MTGANKKTGKYFFCYVVIISCMIMSCDRNTQFDTDGVALSIEKAIEIKNYKHSLPEIVGYELIETNCITCHSLRYIEMQPDLPTKTWENIVHKMVKNFGAPIPDSSVQTIVNYLAEVKGVK